MFMNPQIILADEPTNNLDPENARNVIEMLKQIWQETGATVIVASHDPMVEQYATMVIRVEQGRASLGSGFEAGSVDGEKVGETEAESERRHVEDGERV